MESKHILDCLSEGFLPNIVSIDCIEECMFSSEEEFKEIKQQLIQGRTDYHEAQLSELYDEYDIEYLHNIITIKKKDGTPSILMEDGTVLSSAQIKLINDLNTNAIYVDGIVSKL